MTETLPISVAISTLDRADALARCLEGILSARRPPAEVVIVDQSDRSESRAVVEGVSSGATKMVYVHHRGRGLGASQNIAISTARNELVAVIDDDCVPGEDWLERVCQTFAEDERLGLVAGRVLPLGPPTPGLTPVSSRTSEVRRNFEGKVAPWHVGSGNNFAVRREAYLGIGGCDERLGPGSPARGGVDMDLFYRLLRAGVRARYEPSIVVYHEQKPAQERLERRPMYGYGTGACFAFWARDGDWAAPRLLGQWLGWRTTRMLRGAIRGRWTAAREEAIMLAWTVVGLRHGLTARERPPPTRQP